MTSLPRLSSAHKTKVTEIFQVFLWKGMAYPEKGSLCCPAEECCWSHKAPQWPINRNCSLNSLRHHPCQSRHVGWQPFSFSKALNPPLQFQLSTSKLSHWKVLHASAKTGQELALMVLFWETLQNAWDWAVPPSLLLVLHQSRGRLVDDPPQRMLRKSLTHYQSYLVSNSGNINKFMLTALTVIVMSTLCRVNLLLFSPALYCNFTTSLGLSVSQHTTL